MKRATGTYRVRREGGEEVRAFVPAALPPAPPLRLDERLTSLHAEAIGALGRLAVAGAMVPSAEWFLYGFVRKEALVSSEIEGTQATMQDVLTYEATRQAERPADAEEVCNYVLALNYARKEMARPRGLPISTRLLCEAHKRLMRGVRGREKEPGEIRRTQNWIGGARPGTARFVPPPPELVGQLMTDLERWIHGEDASPPLVRAGLAHVQFETIHPFLDGNGRIGRLLITLLLEHWGLLSSPLLYLSLSFKRRQQEYYARLSSVREPGDWEGWTEFFLECVREAANDGTATAEKLFACLVRDRARVLKARGSTLPAVRLLDALPGAPVVTLARAIELLGVTKPTAGKAIDVLRKAGVLEETTGRRRDRAYTYRAYLDALTND